MPSQPVRLYESNTFTQNLARSQRHQWLKQLKPMHMLPFFPKSTATQQQPLWSERKVPLQEHVCRCHRLKQVRQTIITFCNKTQNVWINSLKCRKKWPCGNCVITAFSPTTLIVFNYHCVIWCPLPATMHWSAALLDAESSKWISYHSQGYQDTGKMKHLVCIYIYI